MEAERILREAVATTPVDPEAFAFLADASEHLGHDVTARDALVNLDALEGDTAAADVRRKRAVRIGDLSVQAGDFGIAAVYLRRAVDAQPDDWLALGLLAEARWRLGDRTEARELLDRALAGSPRDARLQRIAKLIR